MSINNRNGSSPPGGGKHSFDPNIVKGEKSETEKIYMITEISDTLKNVHGSLFPLNPPQKPTKLKQMFSAPRGVQQNRRSNALYTSLISEFDTVKLNSLKDYGPSSTLEKSFIHKDIHPHVVESMKNEHCLFAMSNMKFVKVKSTLLLILDPHLMIDKSPGDQMKSCIISSRKKWLAANLILFPTSPQVMAAQIVRNHARVFSEDKNTNAVDYQSGVKRLTTNCHGLARALTPEGNMPMLNHLEMSWYRIRKRVLEDIREAANKVTPQTEGAFFRTMPFGLNTMPKLMEAIRHQLNMCDELFKEEYEERIELSDGPDMEDEEMEEEETMDGRMEEEEEEEEGEREEGGMRRVMGGETVHRVVPSLSMQHIQLRQENMGRCVPPSGEMGPSTSRIQSYTKNNHHGRQLTNRGNTQGTRASIMTTQMGGHVMNGISPRGSHISIPPITPTSSNGRPVKMTLRKDENQKLFIHSSPSTSSTAIVPVEKEQSQSISHAPPSTATPIEQQKQTTVVPSSTVTWTVQQPPTQAPPSGTVENVEEKEKEEGEVSRQGHPMETVHTSRPISNGSTFGGGITHSPIFSSSPQLLWRGPDGVIQAIPSIVYVEHTENGLRQVNPPTPPPQIAMAIPSMGGGSARSGSNKRRLSRESFVKRKRMEYGDSGDASSEDSDKEVKKLCLEKKKMVEERRRKREERKTNARKEEEMVKKNEEEERKNNFMKNEEKQKMEEDEERKKIEEEEERKKKEEEEERKKMEEEEMRKKEEENERQKKEENERIELERLRKEDELMKTRSMEEEEERRNDEDDDSGSEEQEEVTVLAEDSTQENDENEDEQMGARESEDEVVAESVIDQSENEEKEEETIPSTISTTNEISNGNGHKSMETERNEMNGVVVSSSPQDEDDDIEFVGVVVGEERQMSKIVMESIMKKELNENADNEVIYIEEKKGNGKLPSRRKSTMKENGTLTGWIKEGTEKVKEEETNDDNDSVKKEVNEESMIARKGGINGETVSDTRLSDVVKSEVKEEEENEMEEEGEKTMNDRNGENEETRDDTMNRSNELYCEEDEEMERKRIILEAMTQEDSSQIPFTVAHSDVSSEVITAVIPSMESIPMDIDSSTNRREEMTSIDSPQEETCISIPSNGLNESPHEMIPLSVPSLPHESSLSSLPPPLSNQSLSTPPPRSSSIHIPSQSKGEERRTIPMPSTRLSAEMIEMLHKTDSLIGSYFDKQERREKKMEKEKEKEKEKEVEVTTEPPMNDIDGDILRFHSMRGVAAKLSDDRRCAIRDESINRCSMAVVFTNRPIRKGEKVTLKVVEVSPIWKGRIRVGLTTKDPIQYTSRNEVPRCFNSSNENGHNSYMYDSGCLNAVEKGSELEVELTERGDELMYSFNGKEMGLMGKGIKNDRPMWLVVDVYGFVRSIEIIDNVPPPLEENEEDFPSDQVNPLNHEVDEPILRSVKEEVTEEEPSHPSHSSHSSHSSQLSLLEKEIESTVQSCVMIVHSQIESLNENGRDGKIPIIITANLPIDTVPTELNEDTVERREEEMEMNTVTITEEVMDNESREEEKEGDNESVEKEEVSIETAIEENDDDDEPPIKKMRIEQETWDVMMEDTRKELENEVKEVEDRGESEEKNEENEEDEKSIVESMNEVIPMEMEEEMVDVEVIGINGDMEEGTKGMEENEEEVIEKGEENMIEKTELLGEIIEEDGRTEIDHDNGVKEDEEEEETKVSNEKVKIEEEKCSSLPLRRRSLFGPGCLPFEFTLQAKEINDDEDKNEEKMEVDEGEKQEMVDIAPIRRLSLFGPGSASFKNIMEKVKKINY
uniref:NHR domain-containing protein n=1 Tax=Pristionchus pacificus TaxID=54126 RepID=A0A8R1U7D9_PRIPA